MDPLRHEFVSLILFFFFEEGAEVYSDFSGVRINKAREERSFRGSGFAKSLKGSMDTLDFHYRAVVLKRIIN